MIDTVDFYSPLPYNCFPDGYTEKASDIPYKFPKFKISVNLAKSYFYYPSLFS